MQSLDVIGRCEFVARCLPLIKELNDIVTDYIGYEMVPTRTIFGSFRHILMINGDDVYHRVGSKIFCHDRYVCSVNTEINLLYLRGGIGVMYGTNDIAVIDLFTGKQLHNDRGSHVCVANQMLYYISMYDYYVWSYGFNVKKIKDTKHAQALVCLNDTVTIHFAGCRRKIIGQFDSINSASHGFQYWQHKTYEMNKKFFIHEANVYRTPGFSTHGFDGFMVRFETSRFWLWDLSRDVVIELPRQNLKPSGSLLYRGYLNHVNIFE